MERPHPPSPRRRALARAAGRVLTSPALAAGLALAAGTLAVVVVAHAAARTLAAAARDQLAHAADPDALPRATAAAAALPFDILTLALPIAIAAALGAILGQTAAARALWIPRRTLRGAPAAGADPASVGARFADATVALVRAAIVAVAGAAVALAALPGLAALPADGTSPFGAPVGASTSIGPADLGASIASGVGAVAGATLATLAIAAIATAALELAVRHRRLAHGLAMTDRERRDDARDAHGDPALRRHRRAVRDDDRAIVAGARVVVIGDALAVAVAWHPGEHPRPARIGRGLDARRLIAAARQSRLPVVADAPLALVLAAAPTAVPDASLPAVATLLAAVGVRA